MYPQQKVLIKLSNGNCRLDFLSFYLKGQSQECTLQPIGMVAYFCHHLSDNYVDLSDIYVDLSDIYVDLSDLYVDLSLIPSVEK